jgi:hypothetical protein
MQGGLRGREGAMGLGRGRKEGWQRGGESFPRGDQFGLGGGRDSIVGGRGGIAGSGIGPLTLVEGAKKLFQDVSRDALNVFP